MLEYRKTPVVNTAGTARERLKNILMRDRVDIAPTMMQMVKDDFITVAGEYFTIVKNESEVYLTAIQRPGEEKKVTYLVCLIPVEKS